MTAKQLKGIYAPDGSLYITLTDGAGNLATVGGGTDTVTVGTTSVDNATNTYLLYNNNGTLGEIDPSSVSGGLTVGTSTVSSGTDTYVLYNNAGTLGNRLAREFLTANRTYYVRTDGSDSNNGLTNTSGGAFLTIQHAVNVAVLLDLGNSNVTIQVADGTYTEAVTLKNYVASGGTITIQGNTTTPANVIINPAGAAFTATSVGRAWTIKGFKFTAGYGIVADSCHTKITFSNIDFGACTGYHIWVLDGSVVQAGSNYTISGGALAHWKADQSGTIYVGSRTLTITGTPAFSQYFAIATELSDISASSNTYSGSATGNLYSVATNSVINTNSGTLPGDGSTSAVTGGQYV